MGRVSRREAVLEAARDLFLRFGYQGTTLRSVADECDMTIGAIYHHFRNKEDLYLSVLADNDIVEQIEAIAELLKDPAFPCSNLESVGLRIWRAVRENEDFFRLAFVDILEFGGRNVKPMVAAMRAATMAVARDLLDEKVRRGEVVDLDPVIVLHCLTDTFLHMYLEALMLGSPVTADTGLSEEEVARQIARLLLNGIRTRRPVESDRPGLAHAN